MKKIIYFSICLSSTLLFSCGGDKPSTTDKKTFSPEEITVETKKANDFFDLLRCRVQHQAAAAT